MGTTNPSGVSTAVSDSAGKGLAGRDPVEGAQVRQTGRRLSQKSG